MISPAPVTTPANPFPEHDASKTTQISCLRIDSAYCPQAQEFSRPVPPWLIPRNARLNGIRPTPCYRLLTPRPTSPRPYGMTYTTSPTLYHSTQQRKLQVTPDLRTGHLKVSGSSSPVQRNKALHNTTGTRFHNFIRVVSSTLVVSTPLLRKKTVL